MFNILALFIILPKSVITCIPTDSRKFSVDDSDLAIFNLQFVISADGIPEILDSFSTSTTLTALTILNYPNHHNHHNSHNYPLTILLNLILL